MSKKSQVGHSLLAGGDSSDSVDENQGKSEAVSCDHINKSVNLPSVRKTLKDGNLPQDCAECTRSKANKKANSSVDNEEFSLLICLKCGLVGCGSGSKHAENHANNSQSVHDLALNHMTWIVWCYKCKIEIPSNSSKKLLECVEFVKKRLATNKKKVISTSNEILEDSSLPTIIMVPQQSTSILGATVHSFSNTQMSTLDTLPKVRGLSNLGNTCFFNAVLQCLGQTPFLLPVLEQMRDCGEKFKLPGGEVQIGDEKEILEPLEGELKEWGPLAKTLADTLSELQSGKSEVYSPRSLLSLLHSKCPQFAGYDQHDSHELLRQLLEMVRTEDLQRYQSAILEVLKLDKKSERDNITDELKRRVKAYGRQANDLMLRPEQVFRGLLVSTLECQACKHTSDHIESFLDLSLPVMADKPIHVRRKSSSEDAGDLAPAQPSKHQIKKERNAARKERRGGRGRKIIHRNNSQPAEAAGDGAIDEEQQKNSEESEDQDQSDADVEDNVELEPDANQNHDVIESGYSSEKPVNGDSACGSPASETNVHLNRDSAIASPVTNDNLIINKPTDQVLDLAIPENTLSKDVFISSPGSQVSMACQPSPLTSSSETNLECRLSPMYADQESSTTLNRPTSRLEYNQEIETLEEYSQTYKPICNSNIIEHESKDSIITNHNSNIHNINNINISYNNNNVNIENSNSPSSNSSNNVIINNDNNESGKSLADCHLSKDSNISRLLSCEDDRLTRLDSEFCKLDLAVSKKEEVPNMLHFYDDNEVDDDDDEGLTNGRGSWSITMAQRNPVEPSGECTLLSCLNQFTAKELMTGNNKVGCEACTKRTNQGKEGKAVLTNASKQLLISSPPAILILHLKRFQVVRCTFKKKCREVKFPMIFDLASYCSMKCKNTPTVHKDQNKLLYSLYGVVEHRGTLHGGHYVAYVKVRAPLSPNDSRWSFLPRSGCNALSEDLTSMKPTQVGAVGGAPESPPGKWYYVSDSRVSDVTEDQVLHSQAYLLFYERIW